MRPAPIAALALLLALASPALADPAADHKKAVHSALERALKAAKHGPTTVPLRDQASLKLPKGDQFIPKDEGTALMTAMGNQEGDEFVGLVVPDNKDEGLSWVVDISYQNAGYVKDDDAKNWNADDLLKSLKDGTAAGNEDRRKQGIPTFEVEGWVEKPTYDQAKRRLVWAASLKNEGDAKATGINYNTYALGREGYISMNLLTDLADIETYRPRVKALLANLDFAKGKRYADFNGSTDKVAEYGLAALVAGVAAHKLGFFALIAAFVVKGFKVIALATIAGLAAVKRFFGNKPSAATDDGAAADDKDEAPADGAAAHDQEKSA